MVVLGSPSQVFGRESSKHMRQPRPYLPRGEKVGRVNQGARPHRQDGFADLGRVLTRGEVGIGLALARHCGGTEQAKWAAELFSLGFPCEANSPSTWCVVPCFSHC